MPYLTVGEENSGSIDLHYDDHGSGRTVVLIHGWPLSGASWEKQETALLAEGYRVITYDRRGFGESSKPSFGYDYDTFTSDLHKLIVELDLRDVTLVGFSMGTGEVAHYFGMFGSERVSRAVFIAPIPPYLMKAPDNPSGVDMSVMEGLLAGLEADRLAFLSLFFADFYNVDVYGNTRVSDEVVRFSWNVAARASAIATHDCVLAWGKDFRPDLPRIDVPVLIIQGDADRILPYASTGVRLHDELRGSQLVTFNQAPHGLTWTCAVEVNRALVDFLSGRMAMERAA